MIDYIKHIYRSLKTFKINVFVLFIRSIKREKHIEASNYINKEDFSIKNFGAWLNFEENIPLKKINETLAWNVNKWINHEFDLLGTGWTSRNINTNVVGFLGFTVPKDSVLKYTTPKQNTILSERALHLIESDYKNIDWQLDIKSGYRWDINKDSAEQSNFLYTPYGVDVKIPWELSRFNHLPLMMLSAKYQINEADKIILEFKNQICDFISHNPYEKGINWANAMEVGIRSVNMLVAFDIAKSLDSKNILDTAFNAILLDSIFEHAIYILKNSEFKRGLSNNHYYANISAILFIGFYFKKSESGRRLINIAAREVFVETKKQFLSDGGNFEASTHYHRLSTEMLLWNCILLKEIKYNRVFESNFDLTWNNKFHSLGEFNLELDELLSKARKALDFSKSITKPNGNIAGCGDQDSGRYLKLNIQGKWKLFNELKNSDRQISMGKYEWKDSDQLWVENDLSQLCIQVIGKNLIEVDNETRLDFPFESQLSKYLIKEDLEDIPNIKPKSVKYSDLLHWHTSTVNYPSAIEFLKKKIEWHLYPNFGIYIAKSEGFFLSINATNNNLRKYWSHGKNDKLSFELQVLGEDIVLDPGCFIYSADEDIRNKFRSTRSHSTISIKGKEQNRWPKGKRGVFNLYNESKCRFLSQIDNKITLLCEYRGIKHIRTFQIHNDHLEIIDECTSEFETHFNYSKLYSEHYGRWKKTENAS